MEAEASGVVEELPVGLLASFILNIRLDFPVAVGASIMHKTSCTSSQIASDLSGHLKNSLL
jgi:hypothetical protein